MTVDQILQTLRERDAVLYVEDGRLKYKGPRRTPDDPIRAAIDAHRAELIALFSPPRPTGWSDRLNRETLEPVPGQPDRWREPEASTALCIWCPALLAEGDRLACVTHRERLTVTPFTPQQSVAVTPALALSRDDLLTIAELQGWEALPFKPGEMVGGSEEAWRTFAGWARGETLRLVLAVVWERWRDTAEQYGPGAVVAAAERVRAFVPSTDWQEVPDGYPCPPGGEFRMDFRTGKNWARWREPVQAVAGGEV